MSSTATTHPMMRELSRRTSGALHVALVWDAVHDAVILSVDDLATGDRIRVEPRRGQERYAFEHPFGYLAALPQSGG
jgi:hypothetical protein